MPNPASLMRPLVPALLTLMACVDEPTGPNVEGAASPPTVTSSTARSTVNDHDEGTATPNGTGWLAGGLRRSGTYPGCQTGVYVVGQLHRVDAWGAGDMLDPEQRIRSITALGLVGTRLAFEWSELEPQAGMPQWEMHDRLISALRNQGLEAYGIILFSPPWARPPGEDRTHRPVVAGSAARGDTAFARFAASAARRYRGVIDRWEIWNEPNILRHHFWRHVREGVELGPDPVDYFALYTLARDSIMEANPAARVATGALANGPLWGPVLSPDPRVRWQWGFPAWEFLRGLLDAGLRPSDVALHPYSYKRTVAVNPSLDSVKAVLNAYGFEDTRLWITEWGIDHALPGLFPAAASRLTRSGLERLCRDPRVELVTVYALTQTPGRDYGLVRSDGTATEAGRAVSDWVAGRRQESAPPRPVVSIP